jgi:hypothetical protein
MDWEIVSRVGLPVAIVLALATFLYRKLWPWLTKQIEEGDVERRELLRGLHVALEKHAEISEVTVRKLSELNTNIGSVCRADKRNNAGRRGR